MFLTETTFIDKIPRCTLGRVMTRTREFILAPFRIYSIEIHGIHTSLIRAMPHLFEDGVDS